MENSAIISVARLERMIKRIAWLDALEAAGVDNWEGYDYAREIYAEDNPECEDDE